MNTVQIVFVPYPVMGQTWNKRAPPPQYPNQRRETWPLSNPIPQQETRRQLDSARATIARERDALKQMARQRP
jgi:hypothetical protein